MGAFNTVKAETTCPSCGRDVPVIVQFKYGNTWQLAYELGDQLTWGGNDIGTPGRASVVLDGITEEACPNCGCDQWDVYVELRDDRIVAVRAASGEHDFVSASESFIVLDEGPLP